ncbi:MAG: hypothetical protein ABFC75_07940, partial [Rectinema sp.]
MAARIHRVSAWRVAALYNARRALRKGARAAEKLVPRKAPVSGIIFWLVIAFLFMPLAVLFFYSFNKSRSGQWTGFSFVWYQK